MVNTPDGGCILFIDSPHGVGLTLNPAHTQTYREAIAAYQAVYDPQATDAIFVRACLMKQCEELLAPIRRLSEVIR